MKTTTKKISFMSAIIIVIGSVIGAGIFFKNRSLFSLAQGNFAWVIGAWSVAIVGVMALALALIEVSSRSKTNTGILEWAKNFMPKFLYNSSKNFMVVIFLPITVVTLPFFAIDMFIEAGWALTNVEVLILWFAFLAYFLITNWISLRFSEISQWVFTTIQMIPLFIAPLLAMLNALPPAQIAHKTMASAPSGLSGVASSMVIIAGLPAIMFAFDGFYEASSLRKNMAKPQKNTKAIIVAIAVISIIYIWVTIGFGVGSTDGSVNSLNIPHWVSQLLDVIISIGVISTINGYVMATMNQFEDLDERNESMILIQTKRLLKKIGIKKSLFSGKELSNRFYAFAFMAIITPILTIVFWTIGSFVWDAPSQHKGINDLVDIATNYNSLIIFVTIAGSIVGAMINRKTNKLKVEKFKYFIPTAIIGVAFVALATAYSFIESFVDLSGFNNADVKNTIIKLSIITGFLTIALILGYIEGKWLPKYKKSIGHKPQAWEIELERQKAVYASKK